MLLRSSGIAREQRVRSRSVNEVTLWPSKNTTLPTRMAPSPKRAERASIARFGFACRNGVGAERATDRAPPPALASSMSSFRAGEPSHGPRAYRAKRRPPNGFSLHCCGARAAPGYGSVPTTKNRSCASAPRARLARSRHSFPWTEFRRRPGVQLSPTGRVRVARMPRRSASKHSRTPQKISANLSLYELPNKKDKNLVEW